MSVPMGVASSVASDVVCNENDVIMRKAKSWLNSCRYRPEIWRLATGTGRNALVIIISCKTSGTYDY